MSTNSEAVPFDLDALRARLSSARGPHYWRSLEEIAQSPEFLAYVENEFTPGTSEWRHPVSRRRLLELLGASLGLAGLTACTKQPPEKIVPYVHAPEELVPGKPLFFATALTQSGYARGVLVESHMGRPTKVEGNPEHPDSLGSTDVIAQAEVLSLYDPDRSQAVVREGRLSSWVSFVARMGTLRETLLSNKGSNFRILTETITSPSLADAILRLLGELPGAKWHQYESASRDNVRAGAQMAFGELVHPVYQMDRAEVILSLDADLLGCGPGSVRYARNFAAKRKTRAAGGTMNRLYAVESCPTVTGSIADHRLALRASDIELYSRALAAELGVTVQTGANAAPPAWVKAVAADLAAHKGTGLIVAGDHLPPAVHALAHAMNHALGNVGSTVIYTEPVEASPTDQFASIRELASDLRAGRVETLLVLGGNPVYTAPADLDFGSAMRRARLRIHLGLYDDETSALCHWHVPEAHELESWGDVRAYDGTVTFRQPLIAPLYDGKSALEVLMVLAGRGDTSVYDAIKNYWRARLNRADFDAFWDKSVHDGVVEGTAATIRSVTPKAALAGLPEAGSGIELQFRPDPNVLDGRYANNAWLQELPKPVTRLTWDNAALMAPATAEQLGVSNEQVIEIAADGRTVRAAAWIVPGHAPNAVTLHLGYGRSRGGRLANGRGVNAGLLRTAAQPWSRFGAKFTKTGATFRLACTQEHSSMEGRNLVRTATLSEFQQDPHFVKKLEHGPKQFFSLYPEYRYEGRAWGMTIDLNVCTGCNACTIACQAENNIPIVGKQDVIRGREMHWIRVDRYYEGDLDAPAIYNQPVPCMHCEKAPCEVVCPVSATTHSAEGLNQMTYNRCIGTRYCGNNCPYKVRRFNYFLYSDWETKSLQPMRNPDVTVRSRGVIEKCTFCVQRINAGRIQAEKEGRAIQDGEVVTACQAVCPTNAIIFGDLNDPKSQVAASKRDTRNYGLLEELNTQPRVTYLARLRNPNPALETPGANSSGHGA